MACANQGDIKKIPERVENKYIFIIVLYILLAIIIGSFIIY